MRFKKSLILFIFLINTLIITTSAKKLDSEKVISASEYYSLASSSFEKLQWQKVIYFSKHLVHKYPKSPFTKDALFFIGVAYFNIKDFEKSNRYFSRYLKDDFSPKYFEESMHYKFLIAENYKKGERKRMLGLSKGPKIVNSLEDALSLYDEIISSMPTSDLAIKAMFGKGELLYKDEEYKDSVATFEKLIDKFPTSDLAVNSFIEIGKVYLKQTTYKTQDSDVLDLAMLNLNKLKETYPSEKQKIKALNYIVLQMQELFANGLLEMAVFYEHTKKTDAANLYYQRIINTFPNTKVSYIAKQNYAKLNEK